MVSSAQVNTNLTSLDAAADAFHPDSISSNKIREPKPSRLAIQDSDEESK